MAMPWFGAPGLPPGPWDVPLELFINALDALAPEVDQLAIAGSSFGAEASLLTGALDDRVDKVAAFAPSAVAWAGFNEIEGRFTSKWTARGRSVPAVPIVRPPTSEQPSPPGYLAVYQHS